MGGDALSWKSQESAWSGESRSSRGADSETISASSALETELETLYLIRRPEIIRFLVSFGVNVVEAEDITQEAFLRGFDQCRKNKEIGNFFHWLLTCARNLALNRIRHTRYEIPAPSDRWSLWMENVPRTSVTPETQLLEKEEYKLLADALSSLNPVEQQCVLLRFQEIPFRSIAENLGISMRSAVYHTGTGIRKLQHRLATSAQ